MAKRGSNSKDVWLTVSEHRHPLGYGQEGFPRRGGRGRPRKPRQIPVHFTIVAHDSKESAEEYRRMYQSRERGITMKVVGLNVEQGFDLYSHVPIDLPPDPRIISEWSDLGPISGRGGLTSISGADISANPRRRKKRGADEEDEALAELEAEFPTRLSSHVVANRGEANKIWGPETSESMLDMRKQLIYELSASEGLRIPIDEMEDIIKNIMKAVQTYLGRIRTFGYHEEELLRSVIERELDKYGVEWTDHGNAVWMITNKFTDAIKAGRFGVKGQTKAKANQAEIAVELATQYGPQAIAMAQKYGPAVVAGVKKALEARKK